MENIRDVLTIRPARYSDRAYILKTWLSSYSHSPVARSFGTSYYRAWSGVVEEQYRLAKEIRVACLKEDSDVAVGFVVVGGPGGVLGHDFDIAVHYIAVRSNWRRKGVAKMLLEGIYEQNQVAYSHTPPPEVKDKVPSTWVFEPRLTHRVDSDR